MRRVSPERVDRVSLSAGVACLLVGAVLGLDQLDLVSLSGGMAAAVISAAAGFVLVVSGLDPRPPKQHRSRRDG